jgi:CspA family cold shock protein
MPEGKVKWYNPTKGFGFIVPSTGGKDVFVHVSAVEQAGLTTLNENDVVSYEMTKDRQDRMSAGELKLLEKAPVAPRRSGGGHGGGHGGGGRGRRDY